MVKPRKRTDDEYHQQFQESLDFLHMCLEAYHNGKRSAWLGMSSQLFMLLCDRTPVALAERVIPDLKLHPLILTITDSPKKYRFFDATKKKFSPQGIELILFNLDSLPIPLNDWLQQVFLVIGKEIPRDVYDNLPVQKDDKGATYIEVPEELIPEPTCVSLEKLISETRHQMGPGHFTPTVRKHIQATEALILYEQGNYQRFYEKYIYALCVYIVEELGRQYAKIYDQNGAATDIDPKDAGAWNNWGVALAKLNRHEEAIVKYQKATDIDPKYAIAWCNWGVALVDLNRHEEAINKYQKATDIDPKDAVAWYLKARTYSLLKNRDKALSDLKKAIDLKPKYKQKAKEDEDFKDIIFQ